MKAFETVIECMPKSAFDREILGATIIIRSEMTKDTVINRKRDFNTICTGLMVQNPFPYKNAYKVAKIAYFYLQLSA